MKTRHKIRDRGERREKKDPHHNQPLKHPKQPRVQIPKAPHKRLHPHQHRGPHRGDDHRRERHPQHKRPDRVAQLRRAVPPPRDGLPGHGEGPLARAEDGARDAHDEVRGREGEEHDGDVEVDEAEPVAEGGARVAAAVVWGGGGGCFGEERRAAVGRGGGLEWGERGSGGVVVVGDGDGGGSGLSVWEVVGAGDGWGRVGIVIVIVVAWAVEGVVDVVRGCALGAWLRGQVAARDAVEKVERGHCAGVYGM